MKKLTRADLKNVMGGTVELESNNLSEVSCVCNSEGKSAGSQTCDPGGDCVKFCAPFGGVKCCKTWESGGC